MHFVFHVFIFKISKWMVSTNGLVYPEEYLLLVQNLYITLILSEEMQP